MKCRPVICRAHSFVLFENFKRRDPGIAGMILERILEKEVLNVRSLHNRLRTESRSFSCAR
jgi:hypothetical protein